MYIHIYTSLPDCLRNVIRKNDRRKKSEKLHSEHVRNKVMGVMPQRWRKLMLWWLLCLSLKNFGWLFSFSRSRCKLAVYILSWSCNQVRLRYFALLWKHFLTAAVRHEVFSSTVALLCDFWAKNITMLLKGMFCNTERYNLFIYIAA